MIFALHPAAPAAPLFGDWPETMIWSCLSGAMGAVWADDPVAPTAALAILGDFCLFAGTPSEELVRFPKEHLAPRRRILVPQNEDWARLIGRWWVSALREERYAIKKEPGIFDRDKLERAAASLPPGYRIQPMDREMFSLCRQSRWSEDFTANYQDWAQFERYGLGRLVMKDRELVSGASSYSGWPGGIEVEIDTHPDYRRKGLAYAAAAALILACLDRGLYPSWDAQNPESAALAEKLGYHISHRYPVYYDAGEG